MADDEIGPEAAQSIHTDLWHLIHDSGIQTLCGEPILYGARRRLWSKTPEDDRCALCLRRLGVI